MQAFSFPPLAGNTITPIWDQHQFCVGEQTVRILDYLTEHEKIGWTDGLTTFHETEGGDNHFIDQASRANALQQLHLHLKSPNPVILEVGCSSGFMLQLIQQEFPSATVLGADIVKGPLQQLGEKVKDIPLLRFDLTKCPLPDASVDAIVLLNVLEHIEADNLAMAQIKRILKPGGVAVIEVPAGPALYDIYDKMLMHFRRYTQPSLRALARKEGMIVKRFSHLGCFLYPGFWLVKKRNRRLFANASADVMEKQVANNIRTTRNNPLMHMLMRCESFLGRWVSYPFGIRCMMTCVKP